MAHRGLPGAKRAELEAGIGDDGLGELCVLQGGVATWGGIEQGYGGPVVEREGKEGCGEDIFAHDEAAGRVDFLRLNSPMTVMGWLRPALSFWRSIFVTWRFLPTTMARWRVPFSTALEAPPILVC